VRKLVGVVLVTLWVSGCGWADVRYTPEPVASKKEALSIVERSLWEQYRDFAPNSVEVTQDYFRASKGEVKERHRGFVTTAMTTTENTSTVYFDNIGSAAIYYKDDLYQVLIKARSGEDLYRWYAVSQDKAKKFVSALETLMPLDH
jgi:hypothetical protein